MLESSPKASGASSTAAYDRPPEPPADEGVDLRAILGILRRRKLTIISTLVAGFAIALLVVSQLDRKYTAEALVVVDSRDSQLVGFDAGFAQGFGANMIVDTEVEIARSARVLRRVATELDLANAPEFRESRSWLDILGFGGESEEPTNFAPFADLSRERQAEVIEELSQTLDVSRVGLTNVISLQATALTPESAALRANTLAQAYLDEQIASRLESTEKAVAFLRSRVENLATGVASSEEEIDAFVTATLQQVGSPAARQLLERIEAENRSRQDDASTIAEIRGALARRDGAELARLAESQRANLAAQRQRLVQQLEAGSEIAQEEARRRLDALDEEIREAAQRRVETLQVDVALSEGRAANFRRQLETTLSETQLPKEVGVELIRLQREAETQRTLYDSFLAKLRQVEQQTNFNLPDSRIIADAAPPAKPSFPPTLLILAGAMVFSIGAGTGLAFLRETYIGGITSTEQFESLTGVPVFAALPRVADKTPPDLAIVDQPLSAFSETVRKLRIGIDGLLPAGGRYLFVTSELPGDGKTTVALALARHYALTGCATLLIDADLRHPSIHRMLNIEAGDGLLSFLSEKKGAVAEQLTVAKEESSGLQFVLGAETSMVATDSLLMSSRFSDLMDYARNSYDVVVVDTPPAGLFVDAAIVGAHCNLGIFVAQYGSSMPQKVRACLRDLMRAGSAPMCGVLNKVAKSDMDASGYDGKYYRYYGQANDQ